MILIDLLLPCLSFFLRGKIFAGIIALILQCSVALWIVAIIWAIVARMNAKTSKQLKTMEHRIIASQATNE
jgi:TM2 domain-containing membrane protein YozV